MWNEKAYKLMEEFSKYADICRNKNYIIIDLRGNYGGDDSYGRKFLTELAGEDMNFLSKWLYSPATIKALESVLEEYGGSKNPELKELIDELNIYRKKMRNRSRKIIKEYGKHEKSKRKPSYKGTLILLTDNSVASSGESFVADAKYLFEETKQVI